MLAQEIEANKFEIEFENMWERYLEEMRTFAQEGDERDYVPVLGEQETDWETFGETISLKEFKQRLESNRVMGATARNNLLKYIQEREKEADDIESLAGAHQMSMQRHESGSDYHSTYAEFLEAIGQ